MLNNNPNNNHNQTLLNILFIITYISTIIILLTITSTTSSALTIEQYNINSKTYTNKKLDTKKIQSVVNNVYQELVKTEKYIKNTNLRILISEYEIKGSSGLYFFSETTKTHIIVIATDKTKQQIKEILLHEIGHVIQHQQNINLEFFSAFMGKKYFSINNKYWSLRTSEYFAECFRVYYLRTYDENYKNRIEEINTATYYKYNKNFELIIYLFL